MTTDAGARLSAAQEATREGRYPEALEGFLWFHHYALEHDPGQTGVRLSFALSSWSGLAEVYPAARQALRDERAAAESAVLDPANSVEVRTDAFDDLLALNRTLGQDDSTVASFRRLSEEAPEVATNCGRIAFDAVAASGDLTLARRALADPESQVRRRARILTSAEARFRKRDRADNPLDTVVQSLLRAVEQTTTILRATGEDAEIPRIRNLAVELAPESLRPEIALAVAI